jgi:hypothetical protein
MCDDGKCGMKEKNWRRSGQYERENWRKGGKEERRKPWILELERKWGVVEVCVCGSTLMAVDATSFAKMK